MQNQLRNRQQKAERPNEKQGNIWIDLEAAEKQPGNDRQDWHVDDLDDNGGWWRRMRGMDVERKTTADRSTAINETNKDKNKWPEEVDGGSTFKKAPRSSRIRRLE